MMTHYAKNTNPFDRSRLPEPVFDENPGYIDFYWRAWEHAWDHVVQKPGAPASPYIDEAFDPDTIWIWDTCFMVHFCKYAPDLFPGIQSFDNFYKPLHEGIASPLKIHHPDNPPLFAWIEDEYLRFTGDTSRVRTVLPYLKAHFSFIENARAGATLAGTNCPLFAQREPDGYRWSGVASGMDNTPRGREDYDSILWFDLLAQQALAARRIAALARRMPDSRAAEEFERKFVELKQLANRLYWNDQDGIYHDISIVDPALQVRVKTPAAYWGMLAGFCEPEQAARLAALAADPHIGFGGPIPWPTVTPDDPDFHPDGFYWQGGVWLPTAYMATCALREAGYGQIGDQLAERLLEHMFQTWTSYSPSTIWEAYSPTKPEPATDKAEFAGQRVRPDFCGWSALGPISLFIESVIGIHSVDALSRTVHWHLHRNTRHGIKRLKFGDIETSLIYADGTCTVESTGSYTLILNGSEHAVNTGNQQFNVAVFRYAGESPRQ